MRSSLLRGIRQEPGGGAVITDDEFVDFVRTRSPQLLRSAWLLTGDWHIAHDLVQEALEKCWPRWGRQIEHPEAYVHRVMTTTYLSWRRRRRWRERPLASVPDRAVMDEDIDPRLLLAKAMATLTPRQRAVVVLRYFDDLSEAETAAVLRCSTGTVKAHASRGLARLRATSELMDLSDGRQR